MNVRMLFVVVIGVLLSLANSIRTTQENSQCLLELVMIVKNEAGSIAQTIESVKGCVDRYCILDTGSTDNTVQLIRESFGPIPGQVFQEPFVDFASTRNRVLELAGRECKYTLMLSGDEYLHNGNQYPSNQE